MAVISMSEYMHTEAPALHYLLFGDGTPEPFACEGCPFLKASTAGLSCGLLRPVLRDLAPVPADGEFAPPICTGDEWRGVARKEIAAHLAIRAPGK